LTCSALLAGAARLRNPWLVWQEIPPAKPASPFCLPLAFLLAAAALSPLCLVRCVLYAIGVNAEKKEGRMAPGASFLLVQRRGFVSCPVLAAGHSGRHTAGGAAILSIHESSLRRRKRTKQPVDVAKWTAALLHIQQDKLVVVQIIPAAQPDGHHAMVPIVDNDLPGVVAVQFNWLKKRHTVVHQLHQLRQGQVAF
jgi:hypothetical protein